MPTTLLQVAAFLARMRRMLHLALGAYARRRADRIARRCPNDLAAPWAHQTTVGECSKHLRFDL
ncbi:MAG: hypothetical protein JWS10_644 [Cypionkella sp.]|nr:hypothetical protein [Cypionkella sp.]